MIRGNWDHPGFEGAGGWSAASIAELVLMIVLCIAIVVAVVFAVRALVIHGRRGRAAAGPSVATTGAAASSLLAVLEERYAKGEIDRDEFFQRKTDLGLDVAPSAPPAETTPTDARQ